MADQKATELTELTAVANEDILYIVDDPGGTPISKKITRANLLTAAFSITGDLTFDGAYHPVIDPGSDTDAVLLEVNVSGTPQMSWDESETLFRMSQGLVLTTGQLNIEDNGVMNFYRYSDTNTTAPQVQTYRARGDSGTPSAVQSGDRIFVFGNRAYGTTGFSSQMRARLEAYAAENWTDANQGTYYQMRTTEIGTTSTQVKFHLSDIGDLELGGGSSPSAKLHVDQASTTAAKPVLYLDQADVSEEMIEFNTTIGTGNAIEAVGAKTLTPTHFIKVTITGVGTRYFQVGTIA